MRTVRASLALAALLAGAPAVRAEVAVLPVAPSPGPGPALVALADGLRAAMAELRPDVAGGAAVRERMVPRSPEAALAGLDAAHEAARAAYVRGDYQGSARALRALVERVEELPDGAARFGRWTRAMLRLARTELNLGHEQAARGVLERLLRADPDVVVDRALYPASFASAVDRLRAQIATASTGTLAISSAPDGARVFLNGRELGPAPVTVRVPPGEHRLSGAHGALRTGPRVIEVGEARREEVLLDFAAAEALRPDAGPGLAAPPGDAGLVRAAGILLSVDEVVAVSLVEEPDGAFVVGALHALVREGRAREGRVRLQDGEVPPGALAALAEFLVTGRRGSELVELPGERARLAAAAAAAAAAPAVAVAPEVLRASPPPAPRPGRWVGWASLGAGVAAVGLAALGTVETRAAADRYAEARRLREGDPLVTVASVRAYNGAIARGDDARRVATAAWIGAGVAAAGAGVLGYLGWRQTGEVGPFRF